MDEIVFENEHVEIRKTFTSYDVYEIPLYGGKPQFVIGCQTLEDAKKEAELLT